MQHLNGADLAVLAFVLVSVMQVAWVDVIAHVLAVSLFASNNV